jgi:HAD superfamily hydrolase (TIGR01509 family)
MRLAGLGKSLGMSTTTTGGVLFDVDGTLVDSPYLHVVAWWQAFRQFEHDVPMASIHRAIGMGSDRIIDDLLGTERSRSDDDTIRAAHTALFAEYWQRLRPTPGARRLLRACDGRGLQVVLASAADRLELEAMLRAIDADEVITEAISASDSTSSKPAPDLIQTALDRSGLDPRHVVYVGDSVWDVDAAGKLDIPTIGLTCGGISAAELGDAGAVEVYEHPAELADALDRSAVVTHLRS